MAAQKPIHGDPKRSANAVIAGFEYQLLVTLKDWISLGDNEVLYVELAEDIQVVSPDNSYQMKQIKHKSSTISLGNKLILPEPCFSTCPSCQLTAQHVGCRAPSVHSEALHYSVGYRRT